MAPETEEDLLRILPKNPDMGQFKTPSLEEFKVFLDKMNIPEDDREEYYESFMANKDLLFSPDQLAKKLFPGGGPPQPNYLYFFVTIAVLILILGKRDKQCLIIAKLLGKSKTCGRDKILMK